MQKQLGHKIPLTGDPSQLEELERQGHGGEVRIERDKEGNVTESYLLCTEPHRDLARNVEESFTRKPRLSQAEELLERIGGV